MIKPRAHKVIDLPFYNVLDIETNPKGEVIDIGFAWFDEKNIRQYKIFSEWEEFIDFIHPLAKQNKFLRKIYAHNGGNFDWLSLSDWALETHNAERIKLVMVNSKCIGLDFNLGGKRGTLRLRDSLSLLLSSMEKLTSSFNTPHKKIDLSGKLPHEVKKENKKLYYEYLQNDCFSLQDVLREFHQLINSQIGYIEYLPMTVSSLSYTLWKDYFLEGEIKTPWNHTQKEFFRRSYQGGRTDIFNIGEFQKVNGYDINSLYPSMMANRETPVSYLGHWTQTFQENGIYEITYSQSNHSIPPLLMDETSGEFLYSGSGVYCYPEIKKLKELGGTFKIIKGYHFLKMGNLFNKFVNTIYEIRKAAKLAGNTALEYLCKILMNALYGKFGQRPEGEEILHTSAQKVEEMIKDGKKVKVQNAEKNIYSITTDRHIENEFVPIASYITCHARLELFRYIEMMGDSIVYSDTDSVYTTSKIPDEFISSDLGAMKHEFEGEGIFTGKKQYALRGRFFKETGVREETKTVLKGVPNNGRNRAFVDYQDFRIFLDGGRINYKYTTASSVRDVLYKNKKPCFFDEKWREICGTGKSVFRNQEVKVDKNIPLLVKESEKYKILRSVKKEILLESIRTEILNGAAGFRMPVNGEWMGVPSSYPKYMTDWGWKKKTVLNVITKYFDKKKLNEKDKFMIKKLIRGKMEEYSHGP